MPKGKAERTIMNRLENIDNKFKLVSDPSLRNGPAVVQAARKIIKKKMPQLKAQRATLLRLLDKVRGDGPNTRMYQSELG